MLRKIGFLAILLLLIATTVMSALAYFSSQVNTTGQIKSGTLTMQVSANGVDFGSSAVLPWNFNQMAPGDEITGKLYMKNVGTIPAKQVTFEWANILNNPAAKNLAQRIFVTKILDSMDPGDQIGPVTAIADTNADGKTSLAELAALSGRFGFPYDAVSNDPFLPAGGVAWIEMTLQFDPNAGNDFQGIDMVYDLILTARQEHVFP